MKALNGRHLLRSLACVCVLLACASAGAGEASGATLSISIVGNHFVNQNGQTIRLLGVDQPGNEYACEQGWDYADEGDTAANAALVASWDANAVRLPLNEDCWLGINGEPSWSDGSSEAQNAALYRQQIEAYVQDLNADGIYAILDLHWSAPGTTVADGQRPMPDDNSLSFWSQAGAAFAGYPAVVFDAFNEPYSPAADGYTTWPVSWSCWLDGGCTVPDAADGLTPDPSQTYTAVGMQAVVDEIRGAGADQPILLGGLSYANDLSEWLQYEPTDPEQPAQLAASFHSYEGEYYDTTALWNAVIAPVAADVPVVTGEFGEDDCTAGVPADDGWDETFMDWADQNGVSYLAWGWFVGATPACDGNYYLLNADDSPATPNGTALYDHLTALAQPATQPPSSPPTTTTPAPTPPTSTTAAPTAASKCVVPRLAGLKLATARKRLKAAHCALGKVTDPKRQKGRKARPLVVASSSPKSGKHEKRGYKVALKMKRE